jgi:branched-chain amino acid transport system permease protein
MGAATGGSLELARYTAPVQEIVFGLLLVFFLLKEPLGINQITDRILRSANRWPFARG